MAKTDQSSKRVWDCGSALYDSFELSSFQKQLDSAIISSTRTFSMPRLPSEITSRPPPPAPPSQKAAASSSKKLSRSFQKLLRSVFRNSSSNSNSNSHSNSKPMVSSDEHPWQQKKLKEAGDHGGNSKYFVVYEKNDGLSTIQEVPEVAFSPDIGSLVRKTMSDRFTSASVGISCA